MACETNADKCHARWLGRETQPHQNPHWWNTRRTGRSPNEPGRMIAQKQARLSDAQSKKPATLSCELALRPRQKISIQKRNPAAARRSKMKIVSVAVSGVGVSVLN